MHTRALAFSRFRYKWSCPIDRCRSPPAAVPSGSYIVANITYNVVLLFLIKYGSAALFYICSAAILPIANISFTIKPVMKYFGAVPRLKWTDIVGLVSILIGLGVYRTVRESGGPPAATDESGQPLTAGMFCASVIAKDSWTLY